MRSPVSAGDQQAGSAKDGFSPSATSAANLPPRAGNSALRAVAWLIALSCFAWLGWSAWQPSPDARAAVSAITLWTSGATASPAAPDGSNVTLGQVSAAPATATAVPDTATLRRMFPHLQRVEIRGDGIDALAAESLPNLAVSWSAPPTSSTTPSFVYLSAPPSLVVGERLVVQGRVNGIPLQGSTTVSLESPDGSIETSELRPTADGSATFSITSQAIAAAGAFEWKLRASTLAEPVMMGATITAAALPRVFLLQAAPNVEAARLQRWLAQSGAGVSSRTRVSAERERFASANEAPAEVPLLDAAALATIDVVVTTEPALLALSAPEREALDRSITRDGLGLVVLGDPLTPHRQDVFTPWEIPIDEKNGPESAPRVTRLRLADGAELTEPAAVLPGELSGVALTRWLARDSADRSLVAAVPHGRGAIARSLVVESWRWQQSGHPESYARFWSSLLSAMARPLAPAIGRWQIEDAAQAFFPYAPVRLRWTGSSDAARPETATITSTGAPATVLPLTSSTTDPTTARGLFWPTQVGWHHVRTEEKGPTLSFYVQPTGALPGLRTAERHAATAQLVADSKALVAAAPALPLNRNVIDIVAFVLFVSSTAYLWLEQKRRRLLA